MSTKTLVKIGSQSSRGVIPIRFPISATSYRAPNRNPRIHYRSIEPPRIFRFGSVASCGRFLHEAVENSKDWIEREVREAETALLSESLHEWLFPPCSLASA